MQGKVLIIGVEMQRLIRLLCSTVAGFVTDVGGGDIPRYPDQYRYNQQYPHTASRYYTN